jgi:putative membrane protein
MHPLDMSMFTATLAYIGLGTVLFVAVFVIAAKVLPFSLRKEIEEDQNTALAIVLASVVLGIAHIIASAVGSG